MIKVLFKEPNNDILEKEIENTLESLQNEVQGYIEIINMPSISDLVIIFNEEGKLKDLEPNFAVNGSMIFGNVIIAKDNLDGDLTNLEDEEIKLIKKMFS